MDNYFYKRHTLIVGIVQWRGVADNEKMLFYFNPFKGPGTLGQNWKMGILTNGVQK